MDIKNSVVVITSAGSHLGRNLAEHFLSLNANVILVDDNAANLNRANKHCQSCSPTQVFQHLLDDCSFESIQPLFLSINKHFERGIDVLINLCPSLPSPALMDDNDLGLYSYKISQLSSTMLCFTKLAAKQMLDNQKNGVIVNLSYQDHSSTYQTSSLIADFTKSWASELMPYNIRVGGVVGNQDNFLADCNFRHDELIRTTEYIVKNDYFNGRVLGSN